MKLNKNEVYALVNFIQDGFMTHDVYFLDTYLTIRSLTKQDKQLIHSRFKYLDKKYNLNLVLEILSKIIYKIGGMKIDEEEIKKKLKVMNSTITMKLYEEYTTAEEKFDCLLNKMESFAKTNESRNLWNVYKLNISLEKLNENQYFWALLNLNKDKLELYKFEWSKIEYMTNSICAFTNPKEFKRLKNQMNITKQFDEDDEDAEPFETQEQETSKDGVVDLVKTTMNDMVKRKGEGQQEYYDRVSATMVEINKGKVMDEHDRIVRDYELNALKKMLYERRLQSEVSLALRKTRQLSKMEDMNTVLSLDKDGIYREGTSYVGDDSIEDRLAKEAEKEGFFFNGNSYTDVVFDKFFAAVPKDEKLAVFNEVMAHQIDIDKEVEKYLDKNATVEEKEQYLKSMVNKPIETITKPLSEPKTTSNESKTTIKDTVKEEIYFDESEEEMIKRESAAFKAANMNFDLKKDVKVIKNVRKKIENTLDDDNLDQMIIK